MPAEEQNEAQAQEEQNEAAENEQAEEDAEKVEELVAKPENAEDEVFESDAEAKAELDEAVEVSSHGTASPTSERHAVKKRPPRKIQNDDMIAEEDIVINF